jgi:hypothetical protein
MALADEARFLGREEGRITSTNLKALRGQLTLAVRSRCFVMSVQSRSRTHFLTVSHIDIFITANY